MNRFENIKDKQIVVYRHRTLDTHEVFYVGIGSLQRVYEKGKRRSNFWNRVVDKHSYYVEILKTNLTWEDACDLEKLLILEYGRRDLGTGCLVNMTNGGDGTKGVIRSLEYRQKVSERNLNKVVSKETRDKISIANRGRIITQETRKKISNQLIGKPKPLETIAKWVKSRKKGAGYTHSEITKSKIRNSLLGKEVGGIRVIDTQTNIIYPSVKSVSKTFGIPKSTLHKWLNGTHKNKSTFKYLSNG